MPTVAVLLRHASQPSVCPVTPKLRPPHKLWRSVGAQRRISRRLRYLLNTKYYATSPSKHPFYTEAHYTQGIQKVLAVTVSHF